jgi:hypothetical protein
MEQLTKELLPYLDKIAEKLGVSAMYFWGILVKQAQTELISELITYILITIFILVYWKLFNYFNKDVSLNSTYERKRWEQHDGLPVLLMGISGICVIFSITYMLANIITLITLISNPEYWALKQLLQMVK